MRLLGPVKSLKALNAIYRAIFFINFRDLSYNNLVDAL
jgi:hypothetical protein